MTKKITQEDVEKVGELARLKLGPKELASYTSQLEEILEYVGKVKEIGGKKIPQIGETPPHHPLKNIFRGDKILTCEVGTKELLKNTPEVEGTSVKVPAVFGELE